MCLDDYQIAAYIDGLLPKSELQKIETHLNTCHHCFEKAYFLKKALVRESIVNQEPQDMSCLNKISLWIEQKNLKIKEILGKIQAKPLALSYRNSDIKRQTVAIEMDGIEMVLEKSEQDLELHFLSEGQLTIMEKNGRTLFSGDIQLDLKLYLDEQKIYLLKTSQTELVLEFGLV